MCWVSFIIFVRSQLVRIVEIRMRLYEMVYTVCLVGFFRKIQLLVGMSHLGLCILFYNKTIIHIYIIFFFLFICIMFENIDSSHTGLVNSSVEKQNT